jgi:hypothetical protein
MLWKCFQNINIQKNNANISQKISNAVLLYGGKYDNGKIKKINRNYLSLNDKNYFKGWVCNLGLESINIQKDGRISGACHNKLFGMRDYYNIYDEDFKEKFNPKLMPTICEVERCWCQPEQLLTKSKLPSQHPIW